VDYELLNKPSYPGTLGDALSFEYPLSAKAYTAFNKYARSAYQILFSVEYLKSFQFGNETNLLLTLTTVRNQLVHHIIEIATNEDEYTKLLSDAEKNDGNQKYDLMTKKKYELQKVGHRTLLPHPFYTEAVAHIKNQEPIFEHFCYYLALLHLAGYQRVVDFATEKNSTPIAYQSFLTRKKYSDPENHAHNAVRQIIFGTDNQADLIVTLLHMRDRLKAIGIPLRQYVLDNQGMVLTAKCGFLDAFEDHIPALVLSREVL
jgi:hypothetical protein